MDSIGTIFGNETHGKGWGREEWIINNEKYCGKLLYFNAGKKFSWHFHRLKDETFHLLSGIAELFVHDTNDIIAARRILMSAGDSYRVTPGLRHQIQAKTECVFIEISTQHFESDSYRIQKGD